MPAGLQVFNSWGTIQIDESYRNYGFRNKFSVSVTDHGSSPPNPAGHQGNVYGFSTPGTAALLVACRADSFFVHPIHCYFDGSTWTFNWAFQAEFIGVGATTADLEFFIFDALDDTGFSNVGLEVFTATGARAFHSDAQLLRIGDDAGPAIQGCDTPFFGTPGRIYAPLVMRTSAHGVDVGFPFGYRLSFHMLMTAGANIRTREGAVVTSGAGGAYANPGRYAALDVTDFS